METGAFRALIRQQGEELYRDMPWRGTDDPYRILVSELMLQQTQVDRVVPKYEAFLRSFPTVADLAEAPLSEVLRLWSGLGYNRRAKFLHEAAKKVVGEFGGVIPREQGLLESLPGVGKNTAGAIRAYAFNEPSVFIETNVRTVYFHHFFDDSHIVTDRELQELAAETLDRDHPREWYWALMDYGSELKRQGFGRLDKSRHYKKQAPLEGSLRQTRGAILRELTVSDRDLPDLRKKVSMDDRFGRALEDLVKEGLVIRQGDYLSLP